MGEEVVKMLDLEKVIKDVEIIKTIKKEISKHTLPHSLVAYYDGRLDVYSEILQGKYNKT